MVPNALVVTILVPIKSLNNADRMRVEGVLSSRGRVFATHIAHEGNPAHPDLADFAKKHGYEVAYDGLVLTV
jgi:phosphoribosyl 1,2-cyclic phosphate phosphodiesterase